MEYRILQLMQIDAVEQACTYTGCLRLCFLVLNPSSKVTLSEVISICKNYLDDLLGHNFAALASPRFGRFLMALTPRDLYINEFSIVCSDSLCLPNCSASIFNIFSTGSVVN